MTAWILWLTMGFGWSQVIAGECNTDCGPGQLMICVDRDEDCNCSCVEAAQKPEPTIRKLLGELGVSSAIIDEVIRGYRQKAREQDAELDDDWSFTLKFQDQNRVDLVLSARIGNTASDASAAAPTLELVDPRVPKP